ncbi:MAG: sialate O-acetylesterase [Candidatus Omnitrophica bacterium]|nr:sialate O-acetylesterase [Candidatus Omnitrophota bacterium]
MRYFKWSKYIFLSSQFLTKQLIFSEIKLPALISDNMVLQQGMEVPIWGQADPNEKVTVIIGNKKISTTADNQGRWMVKFDRLEPGGPFEMTITGKNKIIIKNILVGEVWICSGQSNMAWPVSNVKDAQKEISEANYPQIRFFSVTRTTSIEPQQDCKGKWVECSPSTVGGFSAVGYFFGRELHKSMGIPVGLINSSWGGTPAEAWTSYSVLETAPELKPILERWNKIIANYPQAKEKYEKDLIKWKEDAEKAKDKGQPEPTRPSPPPGPDSPHRPGNLYNGMIAPLIPYAIKGVIWYQGESNVGRAYQYRKLFPVLIHNWRESWGQGDFPFLFVQLANFMQVKSEPEESAWAEMREAQMMALSIPNTGMAVTIDIGDANDIHPKNKQDVGYRLALIAKKIAYGQNIVYSGPIYKYMKVEGNKVRLYFEHTGSGLIAKGGEPLTGFAIAGEERKFVWAKSIIDGNTVVVYNEKVLNPVAVRYAWADNPICNLYNKEGLPASPFRTDDWPGITINNR